MRVLLDTNILARASYSATGPAAELLDRLSRPPHVLVISSFILAELDRVLRYPRLRRVHGLSDEEIQRYVTAMQIVGILTDPGDTTAPSVVPGDAKDDPIVATAIVGMAEVICTRDRHFRHADVQAFCTANGIRILSDVELLTELRQSDESPAQDA